MIPINYINYHTSLTSYILPVTGRAVKADELQTVLTKTDRQVGQFKGRMLKGKVGNHDSFRRKEVIWNLVSLKCFRVHGNGSRRLVGASMEAGCTLTWNRLFGQHVDARTNASWQSNLLCAGVFRTRQLLHSAVCLEVLRLLICTAQRARKDVV